MRNNLSNCEDDCKLEEAGVRSQNQDHRSDRDIGPEEGGGEEEGRKRDRSDSYRGRPPQAQQRPPGSSMAEESRIREKPHCGGLRPPPDHHLWAPTQSDPASP